MYNNSCLWLKIHCHLRMLDQTQDFAALCIFFLLLNRLLVLNPTSSVLSAELMFRACQGDTVTAVGSERKRCTLCVHVVLDCSTCFSHLLCFLWNDLQTAVTQSSHLFLHWPFPKVSWVLICRRFLLHKVLPRYYWPLNAFIYLCVSPKLALKTTNGVKEMINMSVCAHCINVSATICASDFLCTHTHTHTHTHRSVSWSQRSVLMLWARAHFSADMALHCVPPSLQRCPCLWKGIITISYISPHHFPPWAPV